MQLDRLRVEGFKSLRKVDLELRPLNVLIGPNGAGKSNLISLFQLLNEMILENFRSTVRRGGGAEALLHLGQQNSERIEVRLTFERNAYSCVSEPAVDNLLFFATERISLHQEGYETPLDISLGSGHQETRLFEESRRFPNKVIADYVIDALRGWKVYHFHDTSEAAGFKKPGSVRDNLYLRGDARNLAAFLFRLKQTHERHYDRIVLTIRQIAPFFDDFLLRPEAVGEGQGEQVRLEWRNRGSDYPFQAHQLSDGTLRFICLATLLLQPDLPSMILIDEPELGLHPSALAALAGLLKAASLRTRIMVSTQSANLVDLLDPEDLLVTELEDHSTILRRLDTADLAGWLEEYTLGELWEKNVLGGRPRP